MRILTAAVIASMTGPAFAQTQPTRPSAYATGRTMPSAFATAALNPCHSGRSLEYYFAFFHDYRLTDFMGPTSRVVVQSHQPMLHRYHVSVLLRDYADRGSGQDKSACFAGRQRPQRRSGEVAN